MEKEYIKCKCNTIFSESEFLNHFPRCNEFKLCFREFDTEFGKLLKNYSEPKENLLIIRVLLEQYRNVIDAKIKNAKLNFVPPKNGDPFEPHNYINKNHIDPRPNINQGIININKQDKIIEIEHIQKKSYIQDSSNDFVMDEIPKCSKCLIEIEVFYLECIHPICRKCFYILAEENFASMKCQVCLQEISYQYKKDIFGGDFQMFEEIALKKLLGENFVICANMNCKEQISFEKGNVDYNVKNEKGEALTKKHAEHYSENRCRCPSCKIDFCVNCKITPYHMGKTCEEYKNFKQSKKCKYDYTIITEKNRGPAEDVCSNPDCVEIYNTSCGKKLKCGHDCCGTKIENKCPPCLKKDCNNYSDSFDQSEDSYCPICYSEGLGAAPIVKLSCGHYIHHKCIEKRLKNKWIGPKITFSYVKCPQCNNWLDAPNNSDIQKLIQEAKALYEKIIKMVNERMKIEGIDKDPRLSNPSDPYYGKSQEYAMHKISYYLCSKCKNPYFAGLRDCRGGPGNEDNNQNANNPNYEKNDLVCGGCVNLNGVAGISNCQIHGKDYIEYKCKFCCSISSWFCWGTTHFCEDCHTRQCKGDYVNKYTKDRLPKCLGRDKCQLKVHHPDNGEEFALGCAVCRNNSDNFKNF